MGLTRSGSSDEEPGARGGGPDRATSAPAEPSRSPRSPGAPDGGEPSGVAPRAQSPRPDLPFALVASSYELLAPDRLSVRYATGVPECYGSLSRTVVEESATRVLVTLLVRPPDGPPSGPCPDIALVEETEVRLDSPLGDREVVDGGTRQALPRGHDTP